MKKMLICLLFSTTIFPAQPLTQPVPPVMQPQFYQNYPEQPHYELVFPQKPMSLHKLMAVSAVTSVVTSCVTCFLLIKVRW